MKASAWEIEDAQREDIPILSCHNPKAFVTENGVLKGMLFSKVEAVYDDNGKRKLVPLDEPDVRDYLKSLLHEQCQSVFGGILL